MEVWYTDKRKGICHGEIADRRESYGWQLYLVNGKWLKGDQLFQSEKELKDALDEYVQRARWTSARELGRTSTGYCTFRSSRQRPWLL